jgi:hypothetical protein
VNDNIEDNQRYMADVGKAVTDIASSEDEEQPSEASESSDS